MIFFYMTFLYNCNHIGIMLGLHVHFMDLCLGKSHLVAVTVNPHALAVFKFCHP